MSNKNKKAVSDAELNDLFASLKENNDLLTQEPSSLEAPIKEDVKEKKLDKSVKDVYNLGKAFAVHRNKDTGKWDILEIDYNVDDGSARIVDTLMSIDNKLVAQRRADEAMSRVLNKLPLQSMRRSKNV